MARMNTLMFYLESEGCVSIAKNYEVNLKTNKNLQFAVFISWFEEHLNSLPGVEFCRLLAKQQVTRTYQRKSEQYEGLYPLSTKNEEIAGTVTY